MCRLYAKACHFALFTIQAFSKHKQKSSFCLYIQARAADIYRKASQHYESLVSDSKIKIKVIANPLPLRRFWSFFQFFKNGSKTKAYPFRMIFSHSQHSFRPF